MKIFKVIAASVFCIALAFGPAGCKGSGGSSSSSSNSTAGTAPSPGSGFVVLPQDAQTDNGGNNQSILQSVQLFDANGTALSVPTMSTVVYNGVGDIDGAALMPDGTRGVFVDGGSNQMFFFTMQNGLAQQTTGMAPMLIDYKQYGGDEDSVALVNSGDEAIVSTDYSDWLLLISGINSKNPKPAQYITTNGYRDGIALSDDNKVMLARGQTGLDVFAVNAITPTPGAIAGSGMVSYTFNLVNTMAGLGETTTDEAGRDGMDFSHNDSSRAVVITNATGSNQSSITLLTGLPSAPIINGTPVPINDNVHCVAVSGDLAVVGTDNGLEMFSGVSAGPLSYVGSISSYNASNGSPVSIGMVTTVRITANGNYAIAGDFSNGKILTIPISAAGFQSPVGILTGVRVPYSDEMMIH
ncbi:MAG: hypothetical protein M0018_03600 [Nitrospiraceae bacterium]|nr:hypothetical protein [Nitrospiraceae bacterium]